MEDHVALIDLQAIVLVGRLQLNRAAHDPEILVDAPQRRELRDARLDHTPRLENRKHLAGRRGALLTVQ